MAGFVHMFSNKYKTLLLLLVTLAELQISCCTHANPSFQKTCSVLYSNARGKGSKIIVGQQSLNIPGVHWASQSCKRLRKGSLKIVPGCQMKMCNSSNLGGNCELLEPGRYSRSNLSEVFGGSIASISCTCSKECKCSDIFMKKTSCARAYLVGGCNTCHSMYLELSSSKPRFPEKYVGKVEALRLRRGCNLTLYSERDHRGNTEIIYDDITEDYNGVFRSYECKCNDYEFVPKIKPDREASGSKWGQKSLSYRISKYPSSVEDLFVFETINENIAKAFSLWENVTGLSFLRKESGNVDIDISFEKGDHGDSYPFKRPGSSSSHTKGFYPSVNVSSVHFYDNDEWNFGLNEENNFLKVAAHEFGHVLGLPHSDVEGSMMSPWYNSNFTLLDDDIQGIQRLYGKPLPKNN